MVARARPQEKLEPEVASREETPEAKALAEFKNDILISLRQLRAGEVIDGDESLREIRRELGPNNRQGS